MGLGTSLVGAGIAPMDHLVLASRSGLRTGLRIAAGLSAGAAIGTAAWRVVHDDMSIRDAATSARVLAPAALGAALWGASMLVRPLSATIIQRGIASGEEAVAAASGVQRATGVVREGDGTFAVVDLSRNWDLDRAELASLRIGDGSVNFSALVTQDGDLLRPVSGGIGYTVAGSATPPVALSSLNPRRADLIERAIRGRQVGTDLEHNRLIAGSMVGDRTGYASADEAARGVLALESEPGEHLLARAGDRWFAFSLVGPSRYDVAARGTTVGPLDRILVRSGKATYAARAPRTDFSFVERVSPFTTDEPIGRELYLHGKQGAPMTFVQSYDDLDSALGAAQRLGYKDGVGSAGYGVVEGATEGGRYHVYKLGSSANTWWEDELGAVQSVQYRELERRSVRDASGQFIEHQQRTSLWQMERSGESPLVRDGEWQTVSREPAPMPGS